MTDSYLHRLRWEPADIPAAGLVAPLRSAIDDVHPRVDSKMRTEQMLRRVGLPVGSTAEARTSPLFEARDLLRAAAEIEHGLLVQYLYAAYSCTKPPKIRGSLAQIAREEMGHLISVQNLILATGGRPYFGRYEFSSSGDDDAVPFPLTFEPLSLNSLAKYVVAESPELESIDDPALKARLEPIVAAGKGKAHQSINHVGAIYVALYWLFKGDDSAPAGWPDYPRDLVLAVHARLGRQDWHVRAADFARQEDFEDLQADSDKPGEEWNRGDTRIFVRAVPFLNSGEVDRKVMLRTLFEIAEQGEGWEVSVTADQKSHFMRFLDTYEYIKALPADSPPIVADVPVNPSTVAPEAGGFIANREANLWGQVFNVRYRIALLKLALSLASHRSLDTGTIDGRAALINDAIAIEMKSNLKTIALELVKMRRKGIPADGPEPQRAAPPFELPAGSLPNLVGLDPDPKVAEGKAITLLRRVLMDALDDAAGLVNRVNDLPTDLLDSPADRQLLTDIVAADASLRAALD